MPSTYTPIATYTVSSAQTSYTFTSIPSTYTDLILVGSATTNTSVDIWLRFNGDSASTNYSRTFVYGDGSSALSGRTSNASNIGAAYGSTSSSTFVIQLMNYSNTTTYKSLISRYGPSNVVSVGLVGLWRSTAAINQIEISCNGSDTMSAGSTLTLYGILAA